MLIAMLLGIVLAAGIPRVLEGNDRIFVAAYAAMMLLLVAMFARVVPHAGEARGLAITYLVTDLIGALLWIASLLSSSPDARGSGSRAMLVLLIGPTSPCARTRVSRTTSDTSPSDTGCSPSSCSARA